MGFKLLRKRDSGIRKLSGKWNPNSNVFWAIVVTMVVLVQLVPIVANWPARNYAVSNFSVQENVTQNMHQNMVEGLYQRLYKRASEDADSANQLQKFDPLYGFILINGYRMDSIRFAAIGFGATILRNSRYFRECHWISRNGSAIQGTVKVFYPGEHNGHNYETVIIHCTLPEVAEYRVGGKMFVSMEGRQMLAYTEKESYRIVEKNSKDFPYQVAFCSPPIYGIVNNDRIREWLQYHSALHFDYMVMYNAGGVGAELKQIFEPYVGEGMLELVDVMKLSHLHVWRNGRVGFMNDCAYRMRHRAKWVMYMDFNEYWNAEKGEVLLRNVLSHFIGNPYVTFGSVKWSIDHCQQEEEENHGKEKWAVERLVYREPEFHCSNRQKYPSLDACLGLSGYRRYAANPRMVASLLPHHVEVPSNAGIDVDASLSHLNRYPRLLKPDANLCNLVVKKEEKVEGWIESLEMSNAAESVRTGKMQQK